MTDTLTEAELSQIRWEYHVMIVSPIGDHAQFLANTLNTWGKQGWEVSAIDFFKESYQSIGSVDKIRIVLKRYYFWVDPALLY